MTANPSNTPPETTPAETPPTGATIEDTFNDAFRMLKVAKLQGMPYDSGVRLLDLLLTNNTNRQQQAIYEAEQQANRDAQQQTFTPPTLLPPTETPLA